MIYTGDGSTCKFQQMGTVLLAKIKQEGRFYLQILRRCVGTYLPTPHSLTITTKLKDLREFG